MNVTVNIKVEFCLQLVSVLREVRYLESDTKVEIPEEATKIFSTRETYRKYIANLNLTQQWYNKVGCS